jgi:hypothetical protein
VRIVGIAPAGTPASYPNVPFSLVVQTDSGSGIKQLQPLPASQIDPPLPQILGTKESWQGTFAGNGVVARGQLFYAGYGQFFYADSPVQTQAFSIVSRDSARG